MEKKVTQDPCRKTERLGEILLEILEARVKEPEQVKRLSALGIPKSKMTMRAVIAAKLFELAAEGNSKAVELIMSICDEKKSNSSEGDTVEIYIGSRKATEAPKEDRNEK